MILNQRLVFIGAALLLLCLTAAPTVSAHVPRVVSSALLAVPADGAAEDRMTDTIEAGGSRWLRIEARANSHLPGRQEAPALVLDTEGHITLVWQSRRQLGRGHELYAQRFDPLGRRVGLETRLNRAVRPDQSSVSGALLADGRTLACSWDTLGQDGSLGGTAVRLFDQGLMPLTDDTVANGRVKGNQSGAVLTALADGGFLVAWYGPAGDQRLPRAWARRFDAAGRPQGPEFRLGHATLAGERLPAVAALPGGGFAAVYAALDDAGRPAGVYCRSFTAEDTAGEPIRLNSGDGLGAIEPMIAVSGNGRLLAAWLELQDDETEGWNVRARLIEDDGRTPGPAFTVHRDLAGIQNGPAAAFLPDGRFLVAWNHFTAGSRGSDVRIRLFAGDGTPAGDAFRLTRSKDGEQRLAEASGRPRLAVGRQGQLAVAWSGAGEGLEDDHGSYLTLLLPEAEQFTVDAGTARLVRQTRSFRSAGADLIAARRPLESPVTRTYHAIADLAAPHEPPIWDPTLRRDQIPFGGDPSPVPLADDGFFGVASTGWTPPDPHLAVGPDHVVVMTNGAIAFHEKDTGNQIFIDEIEDSYGFWGAQGATNFVFDPEVVYDPHTGRFMAMANERGTSNDSYFLLAVSDDSNPVGTWYKYRIDATTHCGGTIDSPNIAVDSQAVYLTADCWTSYNYVIYILNKTPLLSGGTATVTNALTITGPQSHGIPVTYGSAPAQYMIEHFESSSNTTVRLHAITDPLGSPSRVTYNLTVPAYSPPEDPPQLGTSTRPESFDNRFWSCVWRNGSLWACHHIGSSRVLARWYEIDTGNWPVSGTPTLVQSGTVDPGAGVRTFFNSISVDEAGNAAMCFARSASTEYISMARASRCVDDPAGTMPDQAILKASTAGSTSGRWGDYSAVAVDPVDGVTFWMHHEYTTSGSSWNTWIGAHDPECGVQPQDTLAASLSCVPGSGTLPFTSGFGVQLENLVSEIRRAAARIDVQLASGASYSNWRSGYTTLDPLEVYTTGWSQSFPAAGGLVGVNTFTLVAEDVTPPPYNQPPYLPAGHTDGGSCTVTAAAP